MEFSVEPSPRGGYAVRLTGHHAPVSHHDTEEEALARLEAYRRGLAGDRAGGPPDSRFVSLQDGTQLLVRTLGPRDGPAVAGLCDDLSFLSEIDHADREALAALDPSTGEAIALLRYTRRRDDDRAAVVVSSTRRGWERSGIERLLRAELERNARAQGIELLM